MSSSGLNAELWLPGSRRRKKKRAVRKRSHLQRKKTQMLVSLIQRAAAERALDPPEEMRDETWAEENQIAEEETRGTAEIMIAVAVMIAVAEAGEMIAVTREDDMTMMTDGDGEKKMIGVAVMRKMPDVEEKRNGKGSARGKENEKENVH